MNKTQRSLPGSEQIYADPQRLIFIQSRAATNTALVAEYAEMMRDGVHFDAAQGVRDKSGQIYVWDGLHRGEAARQVGALLRIDVQPGTQQDAEWLALAANQKHGLKRTQEDKHKIVRSALLHPYGVAQSDRDIARHCGVDHKTVGRMRQELEVTGEIPQITARVVVRTRDGQPQTFTQDISRIGSQSRREDAPITAHADLRVPNDNNCIPEPHDEPRAQEFECPRCGQEKIVGINGSRRWCLHCGAEWPTAAAFLAAANHDARPNRESLQQRFSNLLARLTDEQVARLAARLDELEQTLGQPAKKKALGRHPAFRTRPDAGDPAEWLLSAVVWQAVKDVLPEQRIEPYYRETARLFLTDPEGQAWLRYFGIPDRKVRGFIEDGYQAFS